VIVCNKATVKRDDVDTREKLADPRSRANVCTRSGSHSYNLSPFGAVTVHRGPRATEARLKGVFANMARAPKGGNTDRIKAVAGGEGQIGFTNTDYLPRPIRSDKSDVRAVLEKTGVMNPDQQSWGSYVNIAGAAAAKNAPTRAARGPF
jgi:iron(III) transport system substrate-binding protein